MRKLRRNKMIVSNNRKHILIAALTLLMITACTNHKPVTRVSRSVEDNNQSLKIEDDGETMRIKVKNREKQIDYIQKFDVRKMNDIQKKELEDHILDSLGVKS